MSVAVRRALYGKMAGDSTLTNMLHSPPTGVVQSIYHQQAPDKASLPYVIFMKQAGTPTYAIGARAFDDEVWTIKGVSRDGDSTTQTADDVVDGIATRLDVLLTDGTISISAKTQLYLRRMDDVEYAEQAEGQPRVLHAGAMFRLVYA